MSKRSRQPERGRNGLYPCDETFDISPFRFECQGHQYDASDLRDIPRRYHNGLVTHHSTSPRMAGDCDLTWWTECDPDDPRKAYA